MKTSIIVAASINGVIGKDNKLLWSLPDEMKYFKEKTIGHAVIMGRKTWESIPEKYKPLSNRTNIVVSRDGEYVAEGAVTLTSLEDAIDVAENLDCEESFIIGGGQIYKEAIDKNIADTLYITQINKVVSGDSFFTFNPNNWANAKRTFHPIDDKHDVSFYFDKYVRVGR